MGEHMQAWCECHHATECHNDVGRCHFKASRLDHTTQRAIDVPCECFELRVADVVVHTWPDKCKQCRRRHVHVDSETELCGRCRGERNSGSVGVESAEGKAMSGYEPGDRVQIMVGGPHENLWRIATVNRVQDDGDVVVYFGDQDEDEWVYSPHELGSVGVESNQETQK